MKRALSAGALALALLGVELATGAVSVAARRLAAAPLALVGDGFLPLPGWRVAAGWALLGTALALAGGLAWADGARRRLARDAACPHCGSGTRRIRRRRRHRVLARLLERGLTHRACARCGWSGLVAGT